MKVLKFEFEADWKEARKGKITGTKAGSLLSKRSQKPLKMYYELIADRVAIPADQENVMDRGKRLEDEAIERFEKETKKKVNADLVIWMRDDDENIALSPDGYIGKKKAVEVKCLNSASHIEAWLTQEVPKDYRDQVIQYFVVNDELEKLYFIFYDPRMPKDFFYLTIERKDMEKEVTEYLEMEREVLKQIAKIEESLTF